MRCRLFLNGWPKIFTQPLLIGTRPMTALISVDLPAPFGPTMPTSLPRGTSRSMPQSTGFL